MKCLCDKCKHNDGCPAKEEHGGALRCSAYKPQEQTNEEYIHSLNTEGLAELLYEYRYDNATPQQRLWLSENEGYCKKCITEWLQEVHNG